MSIEHITVSIDSDGRKVDIALQNRPTGEESTDTHEAETDKEIFLVKEKGAKINLIRIIYTICRLNLFANKYGKKVPDIQIYRAFGKMLHMNLDSYNNDFNRSLQDSMGLEKHLKVFEEMMEIMKEKFNLS